MKSYSAFNYTMAGAVLFAILLFGAFEGLSANWTIAAYLTLPLIPVIFFFKNTYQIKDNHIAISTFGKTHRKVWLRDIEKVETGKTIFGKKMAKVFYSPYDFISVKIGERTEEFIEELSVVRNKKS